MLTGRFAWGVVLSTVLGLAVLPPSAGFAREHWESNRFFFRVTSPIPTLSPGENGSVGIEIEGFGTPQRRPGAPDIPTKTVLVAIPPGSTPRLEVRLVAERTRPGVVPRPAPRIVRELSDSEAEALLRADALPGKRMEILTRASREVRRVDPTIYSGSTTFPATVAWLGDIGVLRDQRYVEVHVAPVRFDPTIRGLRIAGSVEITVIFEDGEPTPAPPRVEPLFERLYAESFANYAQGRQFRLSGRERPWVAPTPPGKRGTAAVSSLRVRVDHPGIVRLDYDRLAGTAIASFPISNWRLGCRGESIPLQIHDDGDDSLEPGEWVQFYGEALVGEPKTVLSHDFADPFPDLYAAADFSDVNVYILGLADGPQPTMAERSVAPQGGGAPPEYFEDRARLEVDNAYRPLGSADPWYWLPTLAATSGPTKHTESVELPGLYSPSMPLTVRVNAQGRSEDSLVAPDHRTRVTLSNASGELLTTVDGEFDGRTLFMQEFTWTPARGAPTATPTVEVSLEVLAGEALRNDVILDFVEVAYPREFVAVDEQLTLHWPNETVELEASGFVDAAPEVYELVGRAYPAATSAVRLTGATFGGQANHTVRFRIETDPTLPQDAMRTFLVVGEDAVAVSGSEDLSVASDDSLKDPQIQADMIVIAHPDLLNDAPASPLRDLLDYRATPAGGEISSIVVTLDEIYDTFYNGLPGPAAIEEFLRWVLSDAPGEGWAEPKPTFVMMIGDGSFDYKGGTANGNFVPTQIFFKEDPILGYYASDNVMAAVVGDDLLADMLIGRIPGRSLVQVERVLQKTLDYERNPARGPWKNHFLLLSDRGNSAGEGNLDFETTHARVEGIICSEGESVSTTFCPGSEPYTVRHVRYYSELFVNPAVPDPPGTMNQIIKDAVNGVDGFADGAAVVQYAGHGNFVVWSNDAYFDERPPDPALRDSQALVNGRRLPWLMAHNCLTGGFHIVQPNSMGEDWLHREGGGSVGVFAPTGLSFNYVGQSVSDTIWKDWFGPRKERSIAVPIMHALAKLCSQGSVEPCQHYVLLGDPALRLQLPTVEAPHDVVAVAGNAEVQLDWATGTSSNTTYDVYRTPSLQANLARYTRLNDAPLIEPSFTDSEAVNAKTYYYYVQTTDAFGFRSPRSNFNTDCEFEGPDCVTGSPLNPDPPLSPTGLSVSDPGAGSQLRLEWDSNAEDDLAYYTLHIGTEPGIYSRSMTVGVSTSVGVGGLEEGVTTYFVVTATNTSAKTSSPSTEVADAPIYAPGLRAPKFIDGLSVRSVGTDLVLEWDEVQTDIYGKAVSLSSYEILRGSGSDYDNASLTVIGQCPAPCSAFVDPGASTAPGDVHYRVRAVSQDDLRGALGSEYPAGTNLKVEIDPDSGGLVLSWVPVQNAIDGGPLDLSHYSVFESATPFGVAQALRGEIPILANLTETTILLPFPAEPRYYSILVVDTRGQASPF